MRTAPISTMALAIGLMATSHADAQIKAAPQAAAQQTAQARFRPLSAPGSDLTLRGEYGTVDRAVYVTPGEALKVSALRIAFSNAVSDLPDDSRLTVSVNDQIVGQIALDAASQPRVVSLPLTPGVLTGGFNSVRFTATQKHRVDCSLAATYELWTAIAPDLTGLVGLGAAPEIRRLADLPAVTGGSENPTPIRVLMADGADNISLDRAMKAVNAVVLAGFVNRPRIEIGSEPGEGPGIDLMIADTGALPQGAVQLEPDMGLFAAVGPSGRVTLTIAPTGAIDIASTLKRLNAYVARRAVPGSAAGQRAVANLFGRPADSGSRLSFRDLAMETRSFDGRLLRTSSTIVMPGDFFAAPYGVATMNLVSAYTGTATTQKRMNVRVNDRIIATLPISQATSGGFEQRRIDLPLDAFKPGINTIAIEATLAGDATSCDANRDASRLSISGTSDIRFNDISRVAVLPALSATVGGARARGENGMPLAIAASASDHRYLDAAFTLVGRMTASAQVPVEVSFADGRSPQPGQDRLFVGATSEAPEPLDMIRPAPAAAAALPVKKVVPQLAAIVPVGLDPGEPSAAADGSWMSSVFGEGSWARQIATGNAVPLFDWLKGVGLLRSSRSAGPELTASAMADSLVIAQTATAQAPQTLSSLFDPSFSPALHTMVLVSDPSKLAVLIDNATSAATWSRIDGELSMVSSDGTVTVQDAKSAFYLTARDLSPKNMRLAAAGWLALNQGYLMALSAAIAAMLAITTAAVLRTRRL